MKSLIKFNMANIQEFKVNGNFQHHARKEEKFI